TMPAALVGSPWIRTANSSKAFTGNPTVTFTINQTATVYVALDTRTAKPAWLDASWTLTSLTLTNNLAAGSNTFVLYSKSFAAGQVALAPNDNGSTSVNMYPVIVAGGGAPPPPPPPTPTPTATATATPTPTATATATATPTLTPGPSPTPGGGVQL